jgi:hypothetical protein
MLIGYVVLIPAILLEQNNHLPNWAEWCWGNKDHGNDGEEFWAKKTAGWPRFLRCYVWLALRNPTFNWSKYILGHVSTGTSKRVYGTQEKIGDKVAEGWYFAEEGNVWEFYYIKKIGVVLGKERCIRYRFGWKIDGKKEGDICQLCFVPNPLMPYYGK